ncbi:MAG: hypothetical protein IKM55_00635 [Bacilli bacterium]|nr:hypothetical protein [Bacilli bacterium]
MTKENNKVDFDLSALTLEELIEVYEKIENFLEYLDDSRIEIEEKSGEDE